MAQWLDLLRAIWELAVARRALGGMSAPALLAMRAVDTGAAPVAEPISTVIKRVAWAIPRASDRVPWRADCLVQALAARRWLARSGVPTSLFLGVRKDGDELFASHAWLMAGDQIVTGGSGADYTSIAAIAHQDGEDVGTPRR